MHEVCLGNPVVVLYHHVVNLQDAVGFTVVPDLGAAAVALDLHECLYGTI